MAAVALLDNGQQVSRPQKTSGGRARCSPSRLTVLHRTGPCVGTSQRQPEMLQDTRRGGCSLFLLTSPHTRVVTAEMHDEHSVQALTIRVTSYRRWEKFKYHNLKDLSQGGGLMCIRKKAREKQRI